VAGVNFHRNLAAFVGDDHFGELGARVTRVLDNALDRNYERQSGFALRSFELADRWRRDS
jgi:hypothetical protein